MKIKGMGNINKKEVISIFTKEGKEAIKEGIITWEEAGKEYKFQKVKEFSTIGKFEDSFIENYKRIPEEILELSPEVIAKTLDALYEAYSDGKSDRKKEA